jgi:hypothetical protein
MTTDKRSLTPPPLFTARDIVRLISLAVAATFILWAMWKASDPRTWQWVRVFQNPKTRQPELVEKDTRPAISETEFLVIQSSSSQAAGVLGQFSVISPSPATFDAGVLGALAYEYVPLPPTDMRPPDILPDLVPNRDILRGARDRDVFLVDDPTDPLMALAKLDADARYHLIELARANSDETLAKEARKGVRYTALLEKPAEFRGQVVEIRGDLRWLKHFELKRPVPGMEFVYEGVIEVGGADQSYWVLFTDLPERFPPERNWNRLYLRDVTFRGYFLKVLKVNKPDGAKGNPRPAYLPVLIGHTLQLPPQAPGFDLLATVRLIGMILVVTVILGGLALWLYRRSERRYLAKMAEVRERARNRSAEITGAGAEGAPLPEFSFEPDLPDSRSSPPPNGAPKTE